MAFKLIIGFERREGLSREACHDHLASAHAALVLSVTEFRQYLRGYVQNFADGGFGSRGALQFQADAVAELWFENLPKTGEAFSLPRYLELIRPDEGRFANFSRLICTGTQEHLVWEEGGVGNRKIIRFLTVRPDADVDIARVFWRDRYPELIAARYKSSKSVYRYTQSWPLAEAQEIFTTILPVLCVEEFWLSDDISGEVKLAFEQELVTESDFPEAVSIADSAVFVGTEKLVITPPSLANKN